MNKVNKINVIDWAPIFVKPMVITACLVFHFVIQYIFGSVFFADLIALVGTAIGSAQLMHDAYHSIRQKKMALDYIAIAAIVLSIGSGYYLVSCVVALMVSGGYSLEEYGISTARKSLTALIDRIPTFAQLWVDDRVGETKPLSEIEVGEMVLVRKGEVVPLDGILVSSNADIDESSITGEPYAMQKQVGDHLRSGTVNTGDLIVMKVSVSDKDSSYRHIIDMVRQAQSEKSPMVRIADLYSFAFIAVTGVIAVVAYLISHDISRVLSVLVLATPCPLILATPIALMGGVNAASRRNIIIKRLAGLEALSRAKVLVFDKTGTLTLGRPKVKSMTNLNSAVSKDYYLAVAAAIERNSLHPLAKAIIEYAQFHNTQLLKVDNVTEQIGFGIFADVDGCRYRLSKVVGSLGMSIGLFSEQGKKLAYFEFEDELRSDAKDVLGKLFHRGLHLYLFTGDKQTRADELANTLAVPIVVEAECSPERKKELIEELRNQGLVTVMIGDGINDAPALAAADIGMVFSHNDQTASTDAADVVFLGGDLASVLDAIQLSMDTVRVAKYCIFFGIGASVIGMGFAAFGMIPPIVGAVVQEMIDVIVILYALRTSVFLTK